MSISWLLLASTGLFFSMWMKPAFTNGLWFQFHRALMLASLLVALSGFVCIFVATKDNKIPGLIGFECVSMHTEFEKNQLINCHTFSIYDTESNDLQRINNY